MDDIENRIKKAQSDSSELELLISDYLPLLKKQAGAAASGILEYEDRLSLAMLTFISCVRQYTEKRGSFISFFSVCFHNRITDEIRRQNLYLKNVQTLTPDSAELETAAGKASLDAYDREQERLSLCEEIDRLSEAIGVYGVAWKDLPRICPKQPRAKPGISRHVFRPEEAPAGTACLRTLSFSENPGKAPKIHCNSDHPLIRRLSRNQSISSTIQGGDTD